jgi:pyroglutamyl-peptidase
MIAKVLVTAFEPWGPHPVNSSAIAVAPMDGQTLRGALVKTAVLPVDRKKATNALFAAIGEQRPDAVISFGMLSTGPAVFRVELVAQNRDLPENGDPATILPDAPPVISTGLPAARIHRKLIEANLAAEYSENAGGFVCNHLFFRLVHAASLGQAPITAGFIHVPAYVDPDIEGSCANRQELEDGAWIAVEATIAPDVR